MSGKHRGLVLRRARQLSELRGQHVHLFGWGWGEIRQYGNDETDVNTWWAIEQRHPWDQDGMLRIHPANIAEISGIYAPHIMLSIKLKKIRAIDMIVDFRSGEVLAHKDEILDAETACRLLYFADEFRGTDLGIPPDFQMGVTWEWVDNTKKEA